MERKVKILSMRETMTLISHHPYITRMPSRPMRGSRAWKITRLFPRSRLHCLRHLPRLQPQEQVRRRLQASLPLTQGHPLIRPAPRLHPQERTRCRRMLTMTTTLLTIMGLKALCLLILLAYRCLKNLRRLQRLLRLLINHRRHLADRLELPLGHHGLPPRSL